MSDYLTREIASIVFEDDLETVKGWLSKFGVTLTDENGTTVATSKSHNMKVAFDWDTLNVFDRSRQINYVFFGRFHFAKTIELIESEIKKREILK